MDWGLVAVQWLHVLGGVFWFGGALFSNFVLVPVGQRLSFDAQRRLGLGLFERGDKVVVPIAIATIALGLIRGTFYGPVRSLDTLLNTAYGLTFLVGFLATIATLAAGLLLARRVRAVYGNDAYWTLDADGRRPPEAEQALRAVVPIALLELVLFFVVFTTMILMRFGL